MVDIFKSDERGESLVALKRVLKQLHGTYIEVIFCAHWLHKNWRNVWVISKPDQMVTNWCICASRHSFYDML